jgi:hypothetical protein
MENLGRKALAVITAMITSVAIIVLGWIISTKAPFSAPSQMEYVTRGDLLSYANAAPPLYWAIGLVSYALAGFAGGFIVSKMASRWTTGGYGLSLFVGGLLTLIGLASYMYWTGPLWFLAGTLLLFIPTAAIGHRFAEGPSHPHVAEHA